MGLKFDIGGSIWYGEFEFGINLIDLWDKLQLLWVTILVGIAKLPIFEICSTFFDIPNPDPGSKMALLYAEFRALHYCKRCRKAISSIKVGLSHKINIWPFLGHGKIFWSPYFYPEIRTSEKILLYADRAHSKVVPFSYDRKWFPVIPESCAKKAARKFLPEFWPGPILPFFECLKSSKLQTFYILFESRHSGAASFVGPKSIRAKRKKFLYTTSGNGHFPDQNRILTVGSGTRGVGLIIFPFECPLMPAIPEKS
jgi:hypothetical protein